MPLAIGLALLSPLMFQQQLAKAQSLLQRAVAREKWKRSQVNDTAGTQDAGGVEGAVS